MKKNDLEKRVSDLERRNNYLLLQLKLIYGLSQNFIEKEVHEQAEMIGVIEYLSTSSVLKHRISFIEKNNER